MFVFSMVPLLIKDGLFQPAMVLVFLYQIYFKIVFDNSQDFQQNNWYLSVLVSIFWLK